MKLFHERGSSEKTPSLFASAVIKAIKSSAGEHRRRQLFFLFRSNDCCRLQGLLGLNRGLTGAEVDRDLSHAAVATS